MDLLVAVKVTTHAQQPFDLVVCSCFPKVVTLTMEHDKYSANWFLQNVNVDLVIQLHFWPGLSQSLRIVLLGICNH